MANIPNIENYTNWKKFLIPTYFEVDLGTDNDEVLVLIRAKKDDIKSHLLRLAWGLIRNLKKRI